MSFFEETTISGLDGRFGVLVDRGPELLHA
jgi:hypothetical protein